MFSFSRKMDAFFIYTNNLQETINFCYLISAKPLLVKKKDYSVCKQFISIQNIKTKILRTQG